MRRHWIEGTPPTGKDKMEKKDRERKKINTFILICEKLIRSLGTHFPIFLPRENGGTVSNHRSHIRCVEPPLREVLIPQVIWVFLYAYGDGHGTEPSFLSLFTKT